MDEHESSKLNEEIFGILLKEDYRRRNLAIRLLSTKHKF